MKNASIGAISSEYWGLHRNSMLFSGALFLMCLAKKGEKLDVLSIEFSDLGVGAMLLLLLLASIYCIIALYIEWINGPQLLHLDVKDAYSKSEKELSEQTNRLNKINEQFLATLDGHKDSIIAGANGSVVMPLSSTDEISDILNRCARGVIANAEGRFYDQKGGDIPVNPSQVSHLFQIFSNTASGEILSAASSRQSISARRLEQGLSEMADSVTRFIEEANVQLNNIKSHSTYRLKNDSYMSKIRIYWLGLYLPVALFVNGVVHCIGRLWWNGADSLVLPLLKGMH